MSGTLSRLRIVLCRPSHPGNIGAAARAMKTMGLTDLRLVAPRRYLMRGADGEEADPRAEVEARALASNAADVLKAARMHAALPEAIADCATAFAVTARPREHSLRVLSAREAAPVALAAAGAGPVAFVFGSENAGLTNEEMYACRDMVHIPTAPEARSLNLAQAVQVVAYELFLAAAGGTVPQPPPQMMATIGDLEVLYATLDEAGAACGFFDPAEPKRLRERWRRLFSRVPLEREEANILQGLLRARAMR